MILFNKKIIQQIWNILLHTYMYTKLWMDNLLYLKYFHRYIFFVRFIFRKPSQFIILFWGFGMVINDANADILNIYEQKKNKTKLVKEKLKRLKLYFIDYNIKSAKIKRLSLFVSSAILSRRWKALFVFTAIHYLKKNIQHNLSCMYFLHNYGLKFEFPADFM